MKTGHSAQEVVVSVEALGRFPSRTLDLRALEPWLNGPHRPCRHLILQVKYVLQGAIEAVRPNVSASCRIDELPGESHTISCLAHTPLEHVTNAEFARDLFDVDGAALVGEAGVSRDDKQRRKTRQRRDDFIGHAIGEILLFWVRADILKRQNGDGWPVWKRGVRGTGGNGKSRGLLRNGDGTLLRDADRADEPIASSGQGLDPILAARLLSKHPTQGCDLHCEVALLDSETGPAGFHQRVLGNRDTPSLYEHAQQCDGTMAQRNGLAAPEQCVRLHIKAERTEDVRCCHPDLAPVQK